MKTQKYTIHKATLEVRGHAWGGFPSDYSYSLNGKQHPTTMSEAKAIAGDFESLDSAQVVITEKQITETTTTRRLKP